jgi:AcrR family transcriptional regulator
MATSPRRAGGAKRIAVLDAVMNVVAERGYENSRFVDVAAASGVAVSTLQNYFGSREDMLVEALWRATELEVVALEAIAAAEHDPWNQLVALIDRSLRTSEHTQQMLVEFWRAAMRDEELGEYSRNLQARYRGPFLRAVNNGSDQEVFHLEHDPEDVVDVLLAVLAGIILPRVLHHPTPAADGFRAVLLAQLATSLGITR